jgi:hypothetical protein
VWSRGAQVRGAYSSSEMREAVLPEVAEGQRAQAARRARGEPAGCLLASRDALVALLLADARVLGPVGPHI